MREIISIYMREKTQFPCFVLKCQKQLVFRRESFMCGMIAKCLKMRDFAKKVLSDAGPKQDSRSSIQLPIKR